MHNQLRQYIRLIFEEIKILGEPDLTSQDERDEEKEETTEQSVSSSISGVTTPLGAGPDYPKNSSGKKRSPAAAAGSAFGNAKPVKNA